MSSFVETGTLLLLLMLPLLKAPYCPRLVMATLTSAGSHRRIFSTHMHTQAFLANPNKVTTSLENLKKHFLKRMPVHLSATTTTPSNHHGYLGQLTMCITKMKAIM